MKNAPSPEQIRQVMQARAQGLPVANLAEAMVMREKVDGLEKRNAELAGLVHNRGAMTNSDRRNILDAVLKKYEMEPAEELVKMLKDPADPHFITDTDTRVRVLQDLMQYRMPRLKAVEVTEKHEMELNITILRIGEDGSTKNEPLPKRLSRETGHLASLEIPIEVKEEGK